MKVIFCAECGTRLPVFRKAMANFGRIIDMVEPHVCLEEPLEPDLTPIDIPLLELGKDNKYVQKLNELDESEVTMKSHIGDRRESQHVRQEITTTAPDGIQSLIGQQPNTQPEGDISKEPDEEK